MCSTCSYSAGTTVSHVPHHPTLSLAPRLVFSCFVSSWPKSGPSYQNINILDQSSGNNIFTFSHLMLFSVKILHSSTHCLECRKYLVYSFFLEIPLLFYNILILCKFLSVCAFYLLTSPGRETWLGSPVGLEQNVCGPKD